MFAVKWVEYDGDNRLENAMVCDILNDGEERKDLYIARAVYYKNFILEYAQKNGNFYAYVEKGEKQSVLSVI